MEVPASTLDLPSDPTPMLDYSEPRAIPDEVLALPIEGVNLRAATFGDELGRGALLLSFLRHFG